MWAALAALASFAVLDSLMYSAEVVASLCVCKAAMAITPAISVGLLRTARGRRWANCLPLATAASIMVGTTAQVRFIEEPLVVQVGITAAFATCILVPWRVLLQATCVFIVCTVVAWNTYMGFYSPVELGGVVIISSLSVYITHFFERQRFALWQRDRDFRITKELAERNEEKYRGVVENLSEAVYTLDEDASISYLSPAIEPMSGYTLDELVGHSQYKFVHPDDLPRMAENFKQGFAGHPEDLELRFITKSGEVRWARASSKLVRDEAGHPHLHGTLTDITERKQVEVALQESVERFQQLADNIQDVFWIWTRDYKLLYLSPAFEKLTGLSRKEAVESLAKVLEIAHPDDREAFAAFLERSLGLLSFGDVRESAGKLWPPLVPDEASVGPNPDRLPRFRDEAHLDRRGTARERPLNALCQQLRVFGMREVDGLRPITSSGVKPESASMVGLT